MRYMIMVRATPMTERGEFPPDTDKLMADMATYNEDLARAGVLLDAAGLKPSSEGWRVRWDGTGAQRVVDGPYAESKELVAGYTLIQVRNREEALEWARRFPNPMGEGREGEIEVRPLYELEDFEEKGLAEGADRFRQIATP
jgi:hypothetical protein